MSNIMTDFKEEIKKLFRTGEKDLDFGIYRIINQKNRIIEKYLEEELPEQIKNSLKRIVKIRREEIDKELEEMEKEAGRLGLTPDKVPKMQKRYAQLMTLKESVESIESYEKLVYRHLLTFFSRYYKDGDFINRFFFKDIYLIPYDGSETYLHWATRGMYFVKTSTKYRRFSFAAPGKSVLLRVVEAEEKKGNKKGNNRYFVLAEPKTEETDDELIVNFKIVFENDEIKDMGKNKTERQNKINNDIASKLSKITGVGKEKIVKYLSRFQRNYMEDFFIHKNLKKFLLDQMNFYVNTEILDVDSYISERGTNEGLVAVASTFKDIAKDIINKLYLLEEFKKKAWEKKKFILDTEYVVTLDKLEGTEILDEIIKELKKQASDLKDNHVKEIASKTFKKTKDLDERKEIHDKLREMKNQWLEWIWLEIIDAKSNKDIDNILKLLQEKNLKGKTKLPENLKFLPIDTYYFGEDLKWKILETLSEKAQEKKKELDDLLDGILIQSDNFQALNLLMEKYQDKIQTIYIDPPFNLGTNPDFPYKVNYKDSTWITMLENRISLARDLINEKGSMFVRCDYNGNMYVRLLMNEIFGEENFRNEIVIRKTVNVFSGMNRFNNYYENLYFYSKSENYIFKELYTKRNEQNWIGLISLGERKPPERVFFGKKLLPPKGYHWTFTQENINKLEKEGRLRLVCKNCGYIHTKGIWRKCLRCGKDDPRPEYKQAEKRLLTTNWLDIPGYSFGRGFSTENSEILLKRVIESTSNEGDLILDFFLGSGTTTAVAHKLGRKWIGVEMGDHFWTVVLPRMKKVLAYDGSGISKEKDVKETYNEKTAGGFFKYHVLEQYEDTLENIRFKGIISNEKLGRFVRSSGEIIEYMLEDGIDKSKSKTFLGVDTEKNFKGIKIKVLKEDGSHEEKELDLIETFIYLTGMKVSRMFSRKFGKKTYYVVLGEMRNQKVVAIWRDPCKSDKEKREDEEYIRHIFEDKEFKNVERVFVNSDTFFKNYSNSYDEMRSLLW